MNKCIYKNRLGKAGELAACEYLMEKGLKIIRKNYRFQRAEIDVVACDEVLRLLIFAEVKTRRSKTYGEPEESVNEAKKASIRKAAEGFLYENNEYAGFDVRIDVISVMNDGNSFEIRQIENAF